MTLTLAPAEPPTRSPLAALMAAVCPEHRADILTPRAGLPLVDVGSCRVPDCPGVATAGRSLCVAHADRWYQARRCGVAFEAWLQDCPPRCTPQACLVPGCRFGRHRSQLCHHHHDQWAAAARHGTAQAWAATVHAETAGQPGCNLPGCELWASFGDGFCVSHQGRFNAFRRRTGTTDRDAFLAAVALAGVPKIDLTGLAPQLKLEVQYVVQRFLDSGPRRVNLTRWNAVVRAIHARGATSLLDRTAAEWVADLRLRHGNPDGALFISWGHDQVDRLVHGTGWDREYPLDTWTLDRVGHAATGVARITFAAIAQPWLRNLAKRWGRHWLSIGIGPAGVRTGTIVLGQFSTYLNGLAHPPRDTGDLTRGMVQRWCEDLARDHPEPRARLQLVSVVSTFLRDVHRRLNDKTIRDAWAKAQLIDAHGQPVELDDDHPLVDAAWARRGLDRAKQTLPNGYCGMPLNSPCEHANPCLTCPMFITNADFPPQHEVQLKNTLELIDVSREKGHLRVVEKNHKIVDNLQRIISACQTCPTTDPKAADAR